MYAVNFVSLLGVLIGQTYNLNKYIYSNKLDTLKISAYHTGFIAEFVCTYIISKDKIIRTLATKCSVIGY